MALQTALFAVAAILFFAIKFFNRTDIPKIKGLPEIPGVPIFGSLISLGNSHPRYAGRLAKKYGAVFQARLGNRVSWPHFAPSFQSFRPASLLVVNLILLVPGGKETHKQSFRSDSLVVIISPHLIPGRTDCIFKR
jgi:phenylacetate 2-hydroxylase